MGGRWFYLGGTWVGSWVHLGGQSIGEHAPGVALWTRDLERGDNPGLDAGAHGLLVDAQMQGGFLDTQTFHVEPSMWDEFSTGYR